MVGVWPTGTSKGEWSRSAKSFVVDTLSDDFVHIDYKSEKGEDDVYEVDVYCQTEHKNCYVSFGDVLNTHGLAFLEDKKKSIDMLLANRSALKEGLKIPGSDSQQKYYNKPELLDDQLIYDVVVTHMDLENGAIFLQVYSVWI